MTKPIKIQIDEKVISALEEKASQMGMKLNAYIQMVLGMHVNLDEKS